VEAFRRGASGYVLKDSAVAELTTAIREAIRGRRYTSASIEQLVPDHERGSLRGQPSKGRELTSREREVLQLLGEGKSMKEVGAVLDISPRTVEFHKYRIMEHLNVKTNAELVQQAIRLGLIGP
jgi:DNA-binding NarL/FixJ family response regulator